MFFENHQRLVPKCVLFERWQELVDKSHDICIYICLYVFMIVYVYMYLCACRSTIVFSNHYHVHDCQDCHHCHYHQWHQHQVFYQYHSITIVGISIVIIIVDIYIYSHYHHYHQIQNVSTFVGSLSRVFSPVMYQTARNYVETSARFLLSTSSTI